MTLWWGGVNGIARRKPDSSLRSERSRLPLGHRRSHRADRPVRRGVDHLHHHRHPGLGQRLSWLERRADADERSASVRAGRCAPLLGQVQRAGRQDHPAGPTLDRLERAEQPCLPEAAVHARQQPLGVPGRQGLRPHLQHRCRGHQDTSCRPTRWPAERPRLAATTSRASAGRRPRRSPSCVR